MTAPRDPALVWLDELRLSRPAELHRRVTDLEAQTLSAELAIDALIQRTDQLEDRMASTDDQVAAINANLQNIQGDIQRLNDLATSLQTEIANQDPALATKLQPLVDLSQQIAAATPEPAPLQGRVGNPPPQPPAGDLPPAQ